MANNKLSAHLNPLGFADQAGVDTTVADLTTSVAASINGVNISLSSLETSTAEKFKWTNIDHTHTAALVIGDRYMCDTSTSAFTVTLPAAPLVGDVISFADSASSFKTNNLTIAHGGKNIMGLAEDMNANIDNASFELVFKDDTRGWTIV